LYFWALTETPRIGWIAVLIYTVCCVLRLARFNVVTKSGEGLNDGAYFVGVPSPAGAMLVMLPMFVSFAFLDGPPLSGHALAAYMTVIGILLISRIPTWSFKKSRVPQESVRYFLVVFAVAGAAVLTYPWITLVIGTCAYVVVVLFSLRRKK
jgi:CDP-diacylglycerol--serine O-phosphatidyltransferase